jgi:hypothetical protein
MSTWPTISVMMAPGFPENRAWLHDVSLLDEKIPFKPPERINLTAYMTPVRMTPTEIHLRPDIQVLHEDIKQPNVYRVKVVTDDLLVLPNPILNPDAFQEGEKTLLDCLRRYWFKLVMTTSANRLSGRERFTRLVPQANELKFEKDRFLAALRYEQLPLKLAHFYQVSDGSNEDQALYEEARQSLLRDVCSFHQGDSFLGTFCNHASESVLFHKERPLCKVHAATLKKRVACVNAVLHNQRMADIVGIYL